VASKGTVWVVSAPSGGGKGAVLARVRERDPGLKLAVSATTRRPRREERDGRDYYFVSREQFERWVAEDRFAEWAEVHGNLYGTLKSELDDLTADGGDVVLEIDVQGMRSMKDLRDDVVSVFLMPPTIEELKRRIEKRGDLPPEDARLRLRNAIDEMALGKEYDHIIVNDDLDEAVARLEAIIRARRELREHGAARLDH
jgi:guanylate kinase